MFLAVAVPVITAFLLEALSFVRGVSVHARGLRPRGTRPHLAISMRRGATLRHPDGVRVPNLACFPAEYPTCTYASQRFDAALANSTA